MSRRSGRSGRTAPPPASAAGTDLLAGVERVFIDGSNLLYALGRGGGDTRPNTAAGAVPAPVGAIIGRLRAAFPPSVIVELVFDGPARGGVTGRLATGLRVAYSGRATADRLIDEGVAAQLEADGPAGTWGVLVVTDDRGLRDLVRAKGARTAGTAWLANRIGHVMEDRQGRPGPPDTRRGGGRATPSAPLPKAGTTIGHRRPPRAPDAPDRDQR